MPNSSNYHLARQPKVCKHDILLNHKTSVCTLFTDEPYHFPSSKVYIKMEFFDSVNSPLVLLPRSGKECKQAVGVIGVDAVDAQG